MTKLAVTLALALVASAAAQSGDETTTVTTVTTVTDAIKPCQCKAQWNHREGKCNGTHSGEIKFITYNGCPTLAALSTCEVAPVQSWCETTEENCIEQTKETQGAGWVYCDAQEGGKPQLPFCTCKSKWSHTHGVCANMKGGMNMYGCPSTETMKVCEPDFTDGEVPWCETNEDECLQQENWVQPNLPSYDTNMIGAKWAYCNPDTQNTQLPQCTCVEEGWQPTAGSCSIPPSKGNQILPTFIGCPSLEELESQCGDKFAAEDKPYCHTYQARCNDQSNVNDDYGDMKNSGWTDMIGASWSYCDSETQFAVPPKCECKLKWWHDTEKCFDDEREYASCPTRGELRKCESDVSNTWCETTYDYCDTQPTHAHDDGWSYCNEYTEEPILAPCECKERWSLTEGASGMCTLDSPASFRGCPSVKQIQDCEGQEVDFSWCETTERLCREQTGAQLNDGWVKCDPQSQRAIDGHSHGNMAAAIGLTFVFTVIFCVALFVGFLMAYRRYINRHKRGYSQELLEGGN